VWKTRSKRRLAGPTVCLRYHGNPSFDRDAGFTASCMETLLMTEHEIEPPSQVPRTLTVVAG